MAIGLALLIIISAIIQQSLGHQNFDNGWLFTVAERVLDGARPYVDFIEANPPASFLIYLPAVALSRIVGTTAEFMVCASVFLGGVGVILFTGRILRRAKLVNAAEAGALLNMAVFILLFMPGIQFAQREHIAMFCLLPLLAIYAARGEGVHCSMADAITAALMAGITVSIKPHFALAAFFPLAFIMARRRSIMPLVQVESWAIVSVVLAYAALLIWRYSGFLDVLPMLMDVYVPDKKQFGDLLLHVMFLLSVIVVCGVGLALGKERWPIMVAMPLLACLGFMVSFLLQGKGFPNHAFPCVSFALLAAGAVVVPAFTALLRDGDAAAEWRLRRWPILFGLVPMMAAGVFFCGVIAQFIGWEEHPGLRAAVKRLAPPQPRMIAVSTLFNLGYPVVRQVNGRWVGRLNGLWITDAAQEMIGTGIGDDAYRARLAGYIDRDARMLLEDVRSQKPDIILSDKYSRTLKALRHPDLVAALAGYELLETVENITIWRRKS